MANTHALCVKTSTKIIVDKLGYCGIEVVSIVLKLIVFNYFLRKIMCKCAIECHDNYLLRLLLKKTIFLSVTIYPTNSFQ